MSILLLEADGADRYAFSTRLESEGWAVEVTSSVDATRVALGAAPFDCLVTSQLIPVLLGEASVAPVPARVLVLVGPDNASSDRVRALELGAADVMGKPAEPVGLREMALRVRNLVRGPVPSLQVPIRFGRVVILRQTRVVTLDGAAIHLTPLQYAVLEQLALMVGQVVSTDVLIERCWVVARRGDGSPDPWTQVSRLRSALGSALSIESVYSVGYRLTVPEP